MENEDLSLRVDPRSVETNLRPPVNGHGTTTTQPPPPPSDIDRLRGAEASLRGTPVVDVGEAPDSSANGRRTVERQLR